MYSSKHGSAEHALLSPPESISGVESRAVLLGEFAGESTMISTEEQQLLVKRFLKIRNINGRSL
jgi:hypothetical protein